jgi:tetratricopeptide (TPR) repeat protein
LTYGYFVRLAILMRQRTGAWTALLAAFALVALAGCLQDQIQANQQQLDAQKTELEQLKEQVQVLQNQGGAGAYGSSPIAPNACDIAVMKQATHKGGERMAAGDPVSALGYYQDAVTACGQSAEAQLNLAHAYEITGDRTAALEHYRLAAGANGPEADPAASQKARAAIARLGS